MPTEPAIAVDTTPGRDDEPGTSEPAVEETGAGAGVEDTATKGVVDMIAAGSPGEEGEVGELIAVVLAARVEAEVD